MWMLAELRWRLGTNDSAVADPSAKAAFIATFRSALPDIEDRTKIVHLVAEHGDHIIAVSSIINVVKIPRPGDLHGQWGYLTNVYTRPEFRNSGVGGRLLAEAQRWAKDQGLSMLIVWPSDRSYAFYTRAGYRRKADPLTLDC